MVEGMNTYADYNREIDGFRTKAKKLHKCNDNGLAKMCGSSISNLRNKSSERAFPEMPFWQVVKIVRAGGGDIEFTTHERKEP